MTVQLTSTSRALYQDYLTQNPQGSDSDLGSLQFLFCYSIPQNRIHDPLFLREIFTVAEDYRVAPIKASVNSHFIQALDATWGQEAFVDLIAKLYEPSEVEPLYNLRVRVADCVARRIAHLGDPVQALLYGMPDFAEDVSAALKDQQDVGDAMENSAV